MAEKNPEGPWPGFQIPVEDDTPTDDLGSVAEDILNAFGITLAKAGVGGSLTNVDIKRADALSTLKASLLESYAENVGAPLKEVRINADGEAEFYSVGSDPAGLDPYYTISSSTYIKDPEKVGVMVTGAKPKQERKIYDWYEVIGPTVLNKTVYDTSAMATACLSNSFSTHATVTYLDPLRNSNDNNWRNGAEDIFELESLYDRFIGYSWRITPPEEEVSRFTKIHRQMQSSIPIQLSQKNYSIGDIGDVGNKDVFPDLGTPLKREPYFKNSQTEEAEACNIFLDEEAKYCSDTPDGSTVPLKLVMAEGLTHEIKRGVQVSKFLGLTGVFVVGIPLIVCRGIPRPGFQKEENIPKNTYLYIGAQNTYNTLVKLNEGIHYVTLYKQNDGSDVDISNNIEPEDYLPCIQFANNLKYNDYASIGTGVDFFIGADFTKLLGLFNDEPTARGSILPLENKSGILVNQLWAQVLLDTSCFIINDPAGNAKKIAEGLKVEVLALALHDEPAPIAMNGDLINQEDGIKDNNPTTIQNMTDTAMERAYADMSSGRTMSLNFASLTADQTETLSKKLYDLLRDDDGKVYTHTCGPTEEVEVGQKGPNGGIINTIEYSYTDQGSYLINVTEGPENFGDFAGIDGGMYYKQTEEVTTKGTIIQDAGNHVDYKVRVDGYGNLTAINGCAEVLAVNDRVSITMHNNAVES
jgi:hypothetical protein